MKPLIEITKQLSFGGWEGGSWNSKFNLGRAILIAGPDAEKLKVIYSTSAYKRRSEKYHFLFILEIGHLMAQVYVTQAKNGVYDVRITLSSIASLRTTTVQGHPVPIADQTILWSFQGKMNDVDEIMAMNYYLSTEVGYRETYKSFMQAALKKALTPRDSQDLFWGQLRQTQTDDA